MNVKLVSTLIIAASLVGTANAATLKFVGSDSTKSKNIAINFNGQAMTVGAGTLNFRLDGGDIFEAYCIDLVNHISNGDQYDVNITNTTILPANGQIVENLFAKYASGVDSKNKGAALQLAIWDAVVDGGDGIGTGNFKATADATVANLVSSYQAVQLTPSSDSYQFTYYEAVTHTLGNNNNKFQNVMSGEAVPEPATMVAMAGLGIAALRRRKQSS